MKAPAGAIVRIYLDLVARVGTGDIVETQSGRRYRVLDVREQRRGKHRGRQHLSCVVLEEHAERALTLCKTSYGTCPFGCAKDGAPNCATNVRALACEPSRKTADVEGSATVHKIRWYPRGRRKL